MWAVREAPGLMSTPHVWVRGPSSLYPSFAGREEETVKLTGPKAVVKNGKVQHFSVHGLGSKHCIKQPMGLRDAGPVLFGAIIPTYIKCKVKIQSLDSTAHRASAPDNLCREALHWVRPT